MAAKSVALNIYTMARPFQPSLIMELPWWDAEKLCTDPRFIEGYSPSHDLQWTAELSDADLQTLHEAHRGRSNTGVYDCPIWQKRIQPAIQVIDSTLAGGLGQIYQIVVCVFEWDSGMGN